MYELLDHTADIKFKAQGDTLDDALSESIKAFIEIVGADDYDLKESKDGKTKKIEVESENLESLVFDVLNELIFLQDSEQIVIIEVLEVNIEKNQFYSASITLLVHPILPKMSLLDIKAPTYNEMKAKKEKDNWIIESVLDI